MPKKLKGSRKSAPEPTSGPKARARAKPRPLLASIPAAEPGSPKRGAKAVDKGKGKTRDKEVGRVAGTLLGRSLEGFRRDLGKLARRRATLGVLDRLELAIEEVRLGGRDSPRTRRLLAAGLPKMAQKVIEEAGETAIEALRGDPAALVNEAADLFYNVMMLLSAAGVPIASIWREMDRREVTIGMAEKLPKVVDIDS